MMPLPTYTTAQTLTLAVMLGWAFLSLFAAILLAMPNHVHPTTRCTTQCAYLSFVYAGFAGAQFHTLAALIMLGVGIGLYWHEWVKVMRERKYVRATTPAVKLPTM